MLEAITASYKSYLENTFQKNSGQMITLISKARDDLNKEVRALDAKYLEFRRKSTVLASDEAGRTFIAQRLEQSDQALNEAKKKAINLRMQLRSGAS